LTISRLSISSPVPGSCAVLEELAHRSVDALAPIRS